MQSLLPMSLGSPATRVAFPLVAAAFTVWATSFIASTSSVAWTGERDFCLIDDAMISMRLADELAHGRGLVWNPGERIEGYTDLFMTMLMAVPSALVDRRFAVVGPWVTRHCEEVVFEGQRLLFRRDSPFVDWRRLGRRSPGSRVRQRPQGPGLEEDD
jgi:hypothetical protein